MFSTNDSDYAMVCGRKQENPSQLVPIHEALQAYDSLSPFEIIHLLRVFEILSVVKNLKMAVTV